MPHSLSQQIFMMRNDVFDKTKLQARKEVLIIYH